MNQPMTDIEHTIRYRIIRGILAVLARMPLGVLYVVSDFIFFVLSYIMRYRRHIVTRNISASFPEFTSAQVRRTRRQFYRNFADYIVETLKLMHISDNEMRRRMTFSGIETVDRILSSGRPIVAYFSHCGNWEWVTSITLWSKLSDEGIRADFCQVYRPLRNGIMDALMLHLRSRFGSISLKKKLVFLDLMRYRRQGIPTITGFMSDQKPSHGDEGHVVNFLHHPTLMITGTETVARRLDAAVVYFDIHKRSRGHYHVDIRLITETPRDLNEFAITDRYASMLSATIRRNPSIWLWSHNRWKHPVAFQ
ncbi:MAG: acetyltransferase [Bacteroidales bacterium]|nr:acetyltransferase [Bacteroidales bacterium]